MSRSFSFVHTADLHLDAPFAGVDATDERVRAALVSATYDALERIADLAIEREAAFVLVAGDAYNSQDRSVRAQLRFRAVLERLEAADIAVYLVNGNHDPAGGFTAGISMPDNVRYFATGKVERIEVTDEAGETLCALYGRGYPSASVRDNYAAGFVRDPADETAIGLLHANVGGQPGYEPYAPCSLDDLRAARMDYWALGHIHKPLDLSSEPKIRYPGSPQGLNPKEDGPHGCWFVTMERGAVIAEEFVETASVLWAREEIDAGPLEDLDALRTALRAACEEQRSISGECPVVMRVDLIGRSGLYDDLESGTDLAELVEDLREEQLSGEPWVWLDRVRNLTRAPIDIEFLRGVEEFTGDLVREADALLKDPGAVQGFLGEALGDIDAALGNRPRDAAALVERARDLCLDALTKEERL